MIIMIMCNGNDCNDNNRCHYHTDTNTHTDCDIHYDDYCYNILFI